MELNLTFRGPYGLAPESIYPFFDLPEVDVPGVYLWVVSVGGKNWVNYVGISMTSIRGRQIDHLRCCLAGDYVVHDANALKNGQRQPIFDPKSHGLAEVLALHENRPNSIVQQLRVTDFYFAECREEREIVERIESAMIVNVRDAKANQLLDNVRVSRNQVYRDIHLSIRPRSQFLGVPDSIWA